MRIFGRKLKIKASRWPWQECEIAGYERAKWGWLRNKNSPGFGRFGGGWNWCLGFNAGGSTIIFNLLFGIVRISWEKVPKSILLYKKETAFTDKPPVLPINFKYWRDR